MILHKKRLTLFKKKKQNDFKCISQMKKNSIEKEEKKG